MTDMLRAARPLADDQWREIQKLMPITRKERGALARIARLRARAARARIDARALLCIADLADAEERAAVALLKSGEALRLLAEIPPVTVPGSVQPDAG